ncbi:MAG: hypothetical protein RRA92_03015 [Gemmatimonadota bacterium]|nr:hypothetical protein [Gemmatimonadota bacterium]
MPASVPPDRPDLETAVDGLERAIGLLLAELAAARSRADRAEERQRRLETTFARSRVDAEDPASLERRLRELSEENARLRAVLQEARERAERIRGRLVVIEDETGGTGR